MTEKIVSPMGAFKTIVEAAMMAPMPEAFKQDLGRECTALGQWIEVQINLQETQKQLELDLKDKKKTPAKKKAR